PGTRITALGRLLAPSNRANLTASVRLKNTAPNWPHESLTTQWPRLSWPNRRISDAASELGDLALLMNSLLLSSLTCTSAHRNSRGTEPYFHKRRIRVRR